MTEAAGPSFPAANCFPEAADHEKRVVDSQAQAKHGGQILNQNGQVPALGQESRNRQSGRDGKLADRQWNQGGDQAAKGHQQKSKSRGDHQAFAAPHVIGARFPNVEIQRNLAGEFELHRRITAPQLIFKRACQLVKLRNERLHRDRRSRLSPTRTNVPPPRPRKIGSRNSR